MILLFISTKGFSQNLDETGNQVIELSYKNEYEKTIHVIAKAEPLFLEAKNTSLITGLHLYL